jgi:hypothetical protein
MRSHRAPQYAHRELAEAGRVLRQRRALWAQRSTIIPQERNIILFPDHDEFRASVIEIESFSFDPRLVNRSIVQ